MGRYPVSEAREAALELRLEDLGIHEADLEEHFIRSGGHGGQNVNKNATCVYLKHTKTGFEVKCQKTRSQGLNRYYARVILADRVDAEVSGQQSERQQRIEKIRRQKRRRSRRAKEKILEDKHHVSQKKSLRKTPSTPDSE